MSFFDDLTQKAKAVASTAGEMAKDAADSAKLCRDFGRETGDGQELPGYRTVVCL